MAHTLVMNANRKPNRRRFLSVTGQALLSFGAFSALPKDIRAQLVLNNEALVREEGLSILQGLTTHDFTQVSVDVPKDLAINYVLVELSSGRKIEPNGLVQRESRSHSSWAVDKISFSGLSLGEKYEFQVADAKLKILDQRYLTTVDLSQNEGRVALVSCQLDHMTDKAEKWKSLEQAKPDMIFFLGDNVYGDIGLSSAGPEMLWRRYIETRREVPFYHQKNLIPVIAVWDDHDFGKNNTNHTYVHKLDSLRTFQSFFPQDIPVSECKKGPGISGRLTAFGHDFMFMDNRFFRDSVHQGDKSFWGQEQTEWFSDELRASSLPTWIIQGCQFYGGYNVDKGQSFERVYQNDFARFKGIVRSSGRPAILVAGDVHMSEVMTIEASEFGYATYEITSSSMHSFPKLKVNDNPRRRKMEKGHNHIIVDIKSATSGPVYEIMCVGKNSKVNFTDKLTLS